MLQQIRASDIHVDRISAQHDRYLRTNNVGSFVQHCHESDPTVEPTAIIGNLDVFCAGKLTFRVTVLLDANTSLGEPMASHIAGFDRPTTEIKGQAIGKRLRSSSCESDLSSQPELGDAVPSHSRSSRPGKCRKSSDLFLQSSPRISPQNELVDLAIKNDAVDQNGINEEKPDRISPLPTRTVTGCNSDGPDHATGDFDSRLSPRPLICFNANTDNKVSNSIISRVENMNSIIDSRNVNHDEEEEGTEESVDRFEVQELLDHVDCDGQRTYRVKWKGYRRSTWEPESHLDRCEAALMEYWSGLAED